MLKPLAELKLAVAGAAVAATLMTTGVAEAGQTRALKIYHLHTHEKATIVFKRNGRYDAAGLKKLNYILRDWRRDEPTRMDPRLFDLIWEVYQKSGSHDYIQVVCGYRAPATNAMLRGRSRRSGVAEKSQHMLGKALDFYIPDVRLSKLREIGMKFQVGGVGFYPTSGSPFVHMDVGGVRSWPRMPRRELARLFPDGKTLHHPAEGGTMPGYAAALADYKRRVGSNAIVVAGGNSRNSDNVRESKSLLAALFSRADESEDAADEVPVQAEEPKADRRRDKKLEDQPILTAAADDEATDQKINAPVPVVRPAFNDDDQPTIETALFGKKQNPAEEAMQAALTPKPEEAEVAKDEESQTEFANLAAYRVPVPQLLGTRKQPGDSDGELMTASLDPADVASLASVPVPGVRPDEQIAKADDGEDMPAGDLKPEEIAALAAETADQGDTPSTDEDETAGLINSLDQSDTKDDQSNLAEMASLDVPKGTVTRSFTLPANVKIGEEEAPVVQVQKVTKGARPHKVDADAASAGSARTEPKLTGNMIAKWAMANGHTEILTKPVKAPRFVSRTMRKQPTEVYADGFSQTTAQVDPARFSGNAVNFLSVKKFSAQD